MRYTVRAIDEFDAYGKYFAAEARALILSAREDRSRRNINVIEIFRETSAFGSSYFLKFTIRRAFLFFP